MIILIIVIIIMILISGLTSTSTTLGELLVLPQCLMLVDLLGEPPGGEMSGNGVNLNIEDDDAGDGDYISGLSGRASLLVYEPADGQAL